VEWEDDVESKLSARDQKKALEALLASRGWSILSGILNSQVQTRCDAIILTPLEKRVAVFQQEYAKGEVAGIKLAVNLPQMLLDATLEDIAQEVDNPNGADEED